MAVRYTDFNANARDFVIRRRAPSITRLIVIFAAALVASICLAVYIQDRIYLVTLLVVMVTLTGWYVVTRIQRNRDLLLATEFQNALFASALGLNSKFCMIIKRNGAIVYIDRSFQDMFPDFVRQSRRTVDVLLEVGKVSKEDSDKVFSAIERGVYDKAVFDIRGPDKAFHKILMSIEPILRPSGFILLRGREFIETRSSDPANFTPNHLLTKSTITLFSYVMDTMNMGVYMAGPTGSLIYTNPVLENWLGYGEGEIIARNLLLQDIVYPDGKKSETVDPDNFEGEVMLYMKTGGMMKCFLNQKVIRDEQGKVLGCTALVHHFSNQDTSIKKKLW